MVPSQGLRRRSHEDGRELVCWTASPRFRVWALILAERLDINRDGNWLMKRTPGLAVVPRKHDELRAAPALVRVPTPITTRFASTPWTGGAGALLQEGPREGAVREEVF